MRTNRIIAAVVCSTAAFAAPAVVAVAAGEGSDTRRALAEVRRATAKYHDVDAALADGYRRASGCIEAPGEGGMGFHYRNAAYAKDPAIEVDKPEILLYAPRPDGDLRLVGVEYFRADSDQDLATHSDRPLFTDVPFQGPMAGHRPGDPVHYDLHVWAWQGNPRGTFAELNPNVRCG